jgi:hypothetical protein
MGIQGYQGEVGYDAALAGLMPHQRELIGAKQRLAALVGGQGNGKTVALCLCAILHAYSEPRGYSLIGRLNMPALIKSTMKTFLESHG